MFQTFGSPVPPTPKPPESTTTTSRPSLEAPADAVEATSMPPQAMSRTRIEIRRCRFMMRLLDGPGCTSEQVHLHERPRANEVAASGIQGDEQLAREDGWRFREKRAPPGRPTSPLTDCAIRLRHLAVMPRLDLRIG